MNKKIYIIGAGGHGQVVLDCARKAGFEVLGFLDDDESLIGKDIQGVRVIGSSSYAKSVDCAIVVAIGDNHKRKFVVEKLALEEERFATIIHPLAIIGSDVSILSGSMILGGVVINTATVIGRHTIVNTSSSIDHHNKIGDFVHIAPGVHTGGYVDIGKLSFVGLGASIINDVKVGREVVVGAGSVVIKDVPDNVTVVGVPSRVIKKGLANE